jgi:thioredoxin reductase
LTTPGHDPRWDDEVDLLVIGGGATGMTAALVGSIEGLRTMPCEKTELVGGTTATSAAPPGFRAAARAAGPEFRTRSNKPNATCAPSSARKRKTDALRPPACAR